jgi:TctA family transporter
VYALDGLNAGRLRHAIIGVLGYWLIRWGCEPVPLLFGFVLALLEENTWASSVEPRISISATSTCPHPVRANWP